jgi:hypothetical protein
MVPTQEKQNFRLNLHWMELQLFYLCCDNRSPDGRDVQAVLTDWMVYQRYAGGCLAYEKYCCFLES